MLLNSNFIVLKIKNLKINPLLFEVFEISTLAVTIIYHQNLPTFPPPIPYLCASPDNLVGGLSVRSPQ